LDPLEVDWLVKITDDWDLDDESYEQRRVSALKWINNPSAFWGFSQTTKLFDADEVISECCSYEDSILKPDPVLRKLRLRILREIVCLCTIEGELHHRSKNTQPFQDVRSWNKGRAAIATLAWEKAGSPRGEEEQYKNRVKRDSSIVRKWLRLGYGRSLGLSAIGSRY
jgi:hypothetical protein